MPKTLLRHDGPSMQTVLNHIRTFAGDSHEPGRHGLPECRLSMHGLFACGREKKADTSGWPPYCYVRDQGPGSVTGQDVHGFGGEWYLVPSDGTTNEREG